MAASCEVLQMRDDPDTDLRHAGCGVVVDHQLYLWGGGCVLCCLIIYRAKGSLAS